MKDFFQTEPEEPPVRSIRLGSDAASKCVFGAVRLWRTLRCALSLEAYPALASTGRISRTIHRVPWAGKPPMAPDASSATSPRIAMNCSGWRVRRLSPPWMGPEDPARIAREQGICRKKRLPYRRPTPMIRPPMAGTTPNSARTPSVMIATAARNSPAMPFSISIPRKRSSSTTAISLRYRAVTPPP